MKSYITAQISTAIAKVEQDFTKTTDFLVNEQRDVRNDLSIANEHIKKLEDQKQKLETNVTELNHRIMVLEKASRSCNIEIQCVPEKKSENVLELVKKLYEIIKMPSAVSEICAVRRVAKLNPDSKRPRNILLTVRSEFQRDTFLSSFKRYNQANSTSPISSFSLGIPGESQRIYVSEHLSRQCKELHAAARRYAKENSYTYCWVKFGRVYLRKEDNSPAIHVKNLDFLHKFT
ncbi:hypothetical protein NE865_01955 [Phthorimaea operculella]|nr:hypothetical protein NE865_01955 [Phthorimaea operculella]